MLHVNLLLTLILAHLLADFPLQTGLVFHLKSKHWLGIVLHVTIHMVVTAALLNAWNPIWPFLLVLGTLHFACDWIKLRYSSLSDATVFLLDQVSHMVILVGLSFVMPITPGILPTWVLYLALPFTFIPAARIYRLTLRAKIGEPKPVYDISSQAGAG